MRDPVRSCAEVEHRPQRQVAGGRDKQEKQALTLGADRGGNGSERAAGVVRLCMCLGERRWGRAADAPDCGGGLRQQDFDQISTVGSRDPERGHLTAAWRFSYESCARK